MGEAVTFLAINRCSEGGPHLLKISDFGFQGLSSDTFLLQLVFQLSDSHLGLLLRHRRRRDRRTRDARCGLHGRCCHGTRRMIKAEIDSSRGSVAASRRHLFHNALFPHFCLLDLVQAILGRRHVCFLFSKETILQSNASQCETRLHDRIYLSPVPNSCPILYANCIYCRRMLLPCKPLADCIVL